MSKLQSLSPSLFGKIIDHLTIGENRRDLPRYASVSRLFQPHIEAITWKELDVRSDELERLRRQITVRRLKYLNVLRLHLPLTQFAFSNDRDATAEQARGNLTFTTAIQSLWNILTTWSRHGEGSRGIRLEVMFDSGQDIQTLRQRVSSTKYSKEVLCLELELFDSVSGNLDLREVSVVSELSISGRHISVRSIITLISRLPSLSMLNVEMEHDTRNETDLQARIGAHILS